MAGFSSIIGHEQIKEHLQNAISMGKVSHAYIFNGPALSGKMALAKSFAMALQCEKKGTDGCMECHSCKQALSGSHPDIIYVHHVNPNSIHIGEIRNQVVNDVLVRPYSSPYKIYIIDDAEKMNESAQNALLKTLEEPPSYAILLLLTENADALLSTIRSRCVTLNLKVVPDDVIRDYLISQCQVPDYKADLCTAFAQGNVGRAIQLAESESFHEIRDAALRLLKNIREMDLAEVADAVKQVAAYKLEINDFFDIMAIWYRDVLFYKATSDANCIIFKDEVHDIKSQASKSSYEGIETIIKALERAKMRLEANVNFDLVIELLLHTIKEN